LFWWIASPFVSVASTRRSASKNSLLTGKLTGNFFPNFEARRPLWGKPSFSEDFKRDTVHQITVRGYAVREVSQRLGVSTYSLYKWMKMYAQAGSQAASVDHEAEN